MILKNDPIGEDLFESRSHTTIATAIARAIDKNDVHMIGIDGPWGAGKSNLVEMIRKKSTNNKYFFIYDAWGHQTDCQRRAIIEEMIRYIHDMKLLKKNDSEWQSLCNDILGKVTETNTEIQDGFSWSSFFILCSIVITPTIISLTSSMDAGILKTILSSVPFFLVLISVVIAWNSTSETESIREKITILKDTLIGAYKRESIQKKKREFVNTHNPSTISFRRFFNKVDNTLPDGNTLIIIIDNLDRLSQDGVQEIWSSIQACFNDSIEELKRIRVIVPFDRNHLKICHEDVKEYSYINDYIDKTFDVVFRVPLPVMTDWKSYFDKQWKEGIGVTEEQQDVKELDYVKNIYDALTLNITPRNIKAFINDMFTLSLIKTNRDIKYRYRAIFCCKKEHILSDPINALIDLEYLGFLKNQFIHDDEFYDAVSALIYQVPLKRGQEVAIYRTLKRALDSADSKRVVELSVIPSFPSVLDKIIREYNEPEKLYQPICALSELTPDNCGGKEIYENRWELIFTLFNDKDINLDRNRDGQNDSYLCPYQEVMLQHGSDEQKIRLVNLIIDRCKELQELDPIIYKRTIDNINNIVDSSCYDVMNKLPNIKVHWDALRPSMEKDAEVMKKYKLSADNDEIIRYLQSLSPTEYGKVNYLRELMDLGYDLSQFHKKLHDNIDRSYDYNNFKENIFLYEDTTSESNPIRVNYNISYLDGFLQSAENQKNENLIDRIICLIISNHSLSECRQYNVIRTYFNEHKEDLPNRLYRIIKYYIDYGTFLLRSKDFKENEIYLTLCKKMTESDEIFYCEDISLLIRGFSDIIKDAHLDVKELADKLSKYDIKEMNKRELKDVVNIAFLEKTKNINDRLTQELRERVRLYLNDLSHDEWKEIAQSGIDSYEFRVMNLVNFEWNQSFKLGMDDYLIDLAEEKKIPPDELKWNKFIESIATDKSELDVLMAMIYDKIKNRDIQVNEFRFWGKWLLKSKKFTADQDTLRRMLTTKVISDKDCMTIILSDDSAVKDKINEIYMCAPSDEKKHFKKILGAASSEGNEDANKLAKNMNININDV